MSDEEQKREKTPSVKIFFSAKTTSLIRRPGLKTSAITNNAFSLNKDGKQVRDEQPVIPLPKDQKAIDVSASEQQALSLAKESLLPYDPNKIGLQIRKPKQQQQQKLDDSSSINKNVEPTLSTSSISRLTEKKEEKGNSNDVSRIIAEHVNPNAYEKIPIEQFGLAMLRGMGWKEGEGIGKKRKLVKPIEAVMRPKGLGLGADPTALARQRALDSNKKRDEGLEFDKAETLLGVGSLISITKGEHKDLLGVIKEILSTKVVIELVGSKVTLTIDRTFLQKASDEEVSNYNKDNLTIQRKDKCQDDSTIVSFDEKDSWLCPHINVYFISKTFWNGALYLKSGDIMDVHKDEDGIIRAVVRLEDGRLVNGASQGQVALIRPVVGDAVQIVLGLNKGQRGRLLEISDDGDYKRIAHVQLQETLEILSMDMSCLGRLV